MEKYKRESACISGDEYKKINYSANLSDFIEICLWDNGDGFDAEVSGVLPQRFQLTWGQFKAMKKVIKFLNKEDN